MTHTPHDAIEALRIHGRAFDRLGVRYYVDGSIASSAHGLPRSTLDADITATLLPAHAQPLAPLLSESFYYDPISARQRIQQRECVNVVYLPKMLKVDIFPTAGLFDKNCVDRAVVQRLDGSNPDSEFPLASPEDIVLHKLRWFRKGGGVSERQWLDVLNVLKVQAGRLDEAYMDKWAGDLGLADQLARARAEAKI